MFNLLLLPALFVLPRPVGGNVPVVYEFEPGQGSPAAAVAKMLAGVASPAKPEYKLDAVFISTTNVAFVAGELGSPLTTSSMHVRCCVRMCVPTTVTGSHPQAGGTCTQTSYLCCSLV